MSIVKARNLRTAGDDKPFNPYAQCTLLPGNRERNTRRTRQIPNSAEPKWNQTMVYPDVSREQLYTNWLIVSVWSLSTVDHSGDDCPQNYDDFLGEIAVDLSKDSDEQERWYDLIETACRPKRHLAIMESQPCSTSSLSTNQGYSGVTPQQESAGNIGGKKWHAYPKRRRSIPCEVVNKVRKPLLPSSYVAVNPLLPRGPVGIGGAAFGRYASVSCPVS